MSKISRRTFTGIAAASVATLSMPSISLGALPRVVVIGGEQVVQPQQGTLLKILKAVLMLH